MSISHLNALYNLPGAKKKRLKLGRGIGSGKGKTCGRGVKGQKARSGVSIRFFEGGQSNLIKRLPKRGFNCPSTTKYSLISLYQIQSLLDKGIIKADEVINSTLLANLGIIKNNTKVKLLYKPCEYDKEKLKNLVFNLNAYSQKALEDLNIIGAIIK